jgi:predicted RNase H-related nuclease YkuK (DUF458 family)
MSRQINRIEVMQFMDRMRSKDPITGEALYPNTKVYMGADSTREKRGKQWIANYTVIIAVHINGRNGCKMFGEMSTEIDYDGNASKPFNRMFMEAQKLSECYKRFEDVFAPFPVELHLDINRDPNAGSNVAAAAAAGYIQGTTGIVPELKPTSLAASFGADRAEDLKIVRRAA